MPHKEALKLALKDLKWVDNWIYEKPPSECVAKLRKSIAAIKEALALVPEEPQPDKEPVDWYSVEGETRRYGSGMVECAYAVGRDEVVYVVTHESVKDIAIQHLPPQRKPLTVDEVWQNDQLMSLNAELGCGMDLLMEVVEAIEAAHGIKE